MNHVFSANHVGTHRVALGQNSDVHVDFYVPVQGVHLQNEAIAFKKLLVMPVELHIERFTIEDIHQLLFGFKH